MNFANKSFYFDLAERVFWTAAQAGLAVVSVDELGLPTYLILPIAAALSAIKGFVARKVGNRNSAATLPAGV